MSEQAKQWLKQLDALWWQEHQTTQARYVEERQKLTLDERVQKGLALRNLEIVDTDAALGGRVMLWLAIESSGPAQSGQEILEGFRAGPGTPVRLWVNSPDAPDAVIGTIARRKDHLLGVMVDDFPEELEEGTFHLDRDEPKATFERGQRAIAKFRDAESGSNIGHLREILLGGRVANFDNKPSLVFFERRHNEPQREAVQHAMAARDIALIHGPPGTGKTHVLVEVIRQAVKRGERVLATAASNAAVDNLAERLAQTELQIVRLGHPARVSATMEAHTLDALVEKTPEYTLSRKWIIEANRLRRKLSTRGGRSKLPRDERRELVREMRHLFRDARQQLQGAQDSILARSQVICATAAGADVMALGDMQFDLVVLDEATQATDPIALVALSRGQRFVMAGDPCQLPPTVIDLKVAQQGLGSTFFERMAAESGERILRMLTVQYRMHETIMAFPSESMYNGQLLAHESVAHHTLEQLPHVREDELRPGPFVFIDTAGTGWEELRSEDDPSTSNPQMAERTAAEVRRLLSRGISPQDVAIITPYDAQVRQLRNLLEPERNAGLEIGSIDGFQGREKEAIILDLVRSNDSGILGFLNDTRRMNVALTRARRFLLVLGDSATLYSSSYYSAFLEAAEQNGAYLSAWDDTAEPLEPYT